MTHKKTTATMVSVEISFNRNKNFMPRNEFSFYAVHLARFTLSIFFVDFNNTFAFVCPYDGVVCISIQWNKSFATSNSLKQQQQLTIYDGNGYPIAYGFYFWRIFLHTEQRYEWVVLNTQYTVTYISFDSDSDRWILFAPKKFISFFLHDVFTFDFAFASQCLMGTSSKKFYKKWVFLQVIEDIRVFRSNTGQYRIHWATNFSNKSHFRFKIDGRREMHCKLRCLLVLMVEI